MTAVVWSPQAMRDIESVRAFIAQDSPAYAKLEARRIVAAVERLQLFPESGRMVPELTDQAPPQCLHEPGCFAGNLGDSRGDNGWLKATPAERVVTTTRAPSVS